MGIASTIHFALLTLSIISLKHTPILATKKSYIVYLGTHSHGLHPTDIDAEVATQSHYDILGSVLGSSEKVHQSVQYSYNKYINGFAAKLSKDEAEMIKTSPHVITVIENRRLELHTTRSWDFLHLEQQASTPENSLWNISNFGDGIIIGNLDTGVRPESDSFNDQDMGPIPSKWKGECIAGSDTTFKCNNKLIGARYFRHEVEDNSTLSPRDVEGHGSHTLSTAGGNFVQGVDILGFGSGTAKGGAPKARVATYKVCWPKNTPGKGGCLVADILAAFEAAINDGVDVLSLSIGGDSLDYKSDGIAIGSFHAVRNGIIVVASAGNKGPVASSVSNIAPWVITVGASTSDRAFSSYVVLGNSNLYLMGESIGNHKMQPEGLYPLIEGADAAANTSTPDISRTCGDDTLDPEKVKGKIVICERGQNGRLFMGQVVKDAGGAGMIIINDEKHGHQVETDPHVLPASHISYADGLILRGYINNTMDPTAFIMEAKTVYDVQHSPRIASFSSRGPSFLFPQILKPDVVAPGVDIIAAYTNSSGIVDSDGNVQKVRYNKLSGTSMASPHVSGIVALLKAAHPDWSPAAIHSAIMTTATTIDNNGSTMLDSNEDFATPFGYGAGLVNPNNAADPGLIYNLTETDYLDYLCSVGSYSEKDLSIFTPNTHNCTNAKSVLDFNYPSISITNFKDSANLTRTLTNVGDPGTTYEVNVTAPYGVSVNVVPSRLVFNQTGDTQVFNVELLAKTEDPIVKEYVFGSLVWSDEVHTVKSPIVIQMA